MLNNKMMQKLLIVFLGFFSLNILADDSGVNPTPDGEEDFALTLPQDYISDYPEERISVQGLDLQLTYKDVVIPGHDGMDIVIGRRFQRGFSYLSGFGKYGWHLDTTVLHTSHNTNTTVENFGCLGDVTSMGINISGGELRTVGYTSANQLPVGTIAAFNDHSILTCEGSVPTPTLRTANGRVISFGESVEQSSGTLTQKKYYVTKIGDRFGNTITYNYLNEDSIYSRKKLMSISRNDGQVVNFNYVKSTFYEFVDSIEYNGRQIQYNYLNELLNTHTDEVGRATSYNYTLASSSSPYMKSVTTPEGLIVDYGYYPIIDEALNSGNLRSKTISGPELKTRTFTYQFYAIEDRTIETEYDYEGTKELTTEYIIDKVPATVSVLAGTVKSVGTYLGAYGAGLPVQYLSHQLLYRKNTVWSQTTLGTAGCKKRVATSLDSLLNCSRPYKVSDTVSIDNGGVLDTYTNAYTAYNDYGEVTASIASNGFSTSKRYTKWGYRQDLSHWVINQPTTTEISDNGTNYQMVNEVTYHDSSTAGGIYANLSLPYEQKAFGQWSKRFMSYHSDGNVNRVEYNAPRTVGSGNRFVSYTDYKRGQAQKISRPARYTSGTQFRTLVIDDNGWVTQDTDFENNITDYGYDNFGRIRSINPVDVTVADTLLEWSYTGGENNNQAQQTISRCTLINEVCSNTKITATSTFDAKLRPVLLATTDIGSGTTIYQNSRYNVLDRTTFQSFVSNSSSEISGTSFEYDGLQRQIKQSVSHGGEAITDYLSGNKTKVTDAKGHITTTTFLAYGSPSYSQATNIASEESVTTDIDIDLFGNITTITQSGFSAGSPVSLTEYRAYDSQKRLCQTKRNDVGTTIYNRNNNGEINWQAKGITGASNTVCTTSAPASQKVTYSYDNLGEQNIMSYGDSSPTVTSTLDNNGQLLQLSAGSVSQGYAYNSSGQLAAESVSIDGRILTLDYGYDSLGALKQITYPNSQTVNFAPNGFGQPTKATRVGQNYVTNATYYPSGQINQFNYANGLVHKTVLNSRNLPQSIKDNSGGVTALHLQYTYDDQNNVKSIVNSVNAGFSINNINYDDLDRLTSTSGGSLIGSSAISYDGLGNIKSYNTYGSSLATSRNKIYNYNTSLNRLSSVTGAGQTYSFSYDSQGNVSNNGTRGFTYNKANQLTNSGTNSYIYDGHNRRVKTTDSKGISYSMYSQSGVLLYRESNVNASTHLGDGVNYIFLGKKLVAKEGVMTVSANSQQHYKPFGETIETPKDDVGYTGHKFDSDLGLSYMQARYYDPAVGRFYSNDPIGFRDVHSFNRYAYANNNPYKYTDPDGKSSLSMVPLVVIPIVVIVMYHHAIKNKGKASNNRRPGYKPLMNESSGDSSDSSDNDQSSDGESGSYTNTHESGKKYHGKGKRKRSQKSGRRQARKHKDAHVSTDYTDAESDREGFKDESRRIDDDGGVDSDSNYNDRESPGKKYRKEDGEG